MSYVKFKNDKLWRDKLPEIMEKRGTQVFLKSLSDDQYAQALRDKLIEEVHEVVVAQSKAELCEELADVYEVIHALMLQAGVTNDEVMAAQKAKYDERGGFTGRTFVTEIVCPVGSLSEQYCRAQPNKYPEITE